VRLVLALQVFTEPVKRVWLLARVMPFRDAMGSDDTAKSILSPARVCVYTTTQLGAGACVRLPNKRCGVNAMRLVALQFEKHAQCWLSLLSRNQQLESG